MVSIFEFVYLKQQSFVREGADIYFTQSIWNLSNIIFLKLWNNNQQYCLWIYNANDGLLFVNIYFIFIPFFIFL